MQDQRIKTFLSNITKIRSEFIELMLFLIAAAVGVNLFSSFLAAKLDVDGSGLWGSAILLLVLAVIIRKRFFGKSVTHKATALMSVEGKKNKSLEIDGYGFNWEFNMVLASLFAENKAIKKQWTDSPLGHDYRDKTISIEEFKKSTSQKLAKEIVEYVYLHSLSTHLTDYFNKDTYDKKMLVELGRNDLADLVTSNRVLDMISKDMADRNAFTEKKRDRKEAEPEGEIVMQWVSNGAMYAKFDLILPKGSKLLREKDGSITIKNSSLTLNFKVVSDGFGKVVDYLFERYYMGIDAKKLPMDIKHYDIDIVTTISIKPTLLIFPKRISYQLWSESFLDSIHKQFSFDAFLHNINWKTVKTVLYVEAKKEKSKRS